MGIDEVLDVASSDRCFYICIASSSDFKVSTRSWLFVTVGIFGSDSRISAVAAVVFVVGSSLDCETSWESELSGFGLVNSRGVKSR